MSLAALQPMRRSRKKADAEPNEWVYRRDNNTLEHRTGVYYVDLDRCESSAAVLDWLFQIFNKTWCTPKTIFDFMTHLQERIRPQARLCSFGMSRPGTKEATS